jgi:glycosyltransferase involved in cell wall biosynthesis
VDEALSDLTCTSARTAPVRAGHLYRMAQNPILTVTLHDMPATALEQDWLESRRLARRGQHAEALPGLTRLHAALAADAAAPATLTAHVRSRLSQVERHLWPPRRHADPLLAGSWIDDTAFTRGAFTAQPKVSIVIPAYQAGELVFDALDSIAAQRMHELETLVVDDASPDGGPSLARLAAYPAWMRIRLLRLISNRGPAHCRNLGALLGQGRAICFLDADDTVDADAIVSRWELLNADPATVGAYVSMALVGDKLQPLGTRILHNVDAVSFTDFASNKFPCSALMLRRSAFLLDLFDETLVYGEDFDCFARMAQRGGVYRRAETGEVKYRQHGASLTHKDTLRDLDQRMTIMRRVHTRRLDWTLSGTGLPLAEATIVRESSLRAFPVGCVFALRGDLEKALQVLPNIAPDMVATLTPLQAANTLRFFLTREEQVPVPQVNAFLKQARSDVWLHWLDTLFLPRHRRFVSALVAELTGKVLADALPLLPRVLGAPLQSLPWSALLDEDAADWSGYLLFARAGESMPPEAALRTRQFLTHRGDLEGLLAYRVAQRGDQCLTELSSIGPAAPDAPEMSGLGSRLRPALLLHEQTAKTLRHWMVQHLKTSTPSTADSGQSQELVETLALQGVQALRLKVMGGVPSCFVLGQLPDARP